jgi:hypothetical protein
VAVSPSSRRASAEASSVTYRTDYAPGAGPFA